MKRNNAFTLIELLVVVGIIAVLVGILLPTLSRAREAAKRTTCQANLRSIGQAIRTYMDDHNGVYPPMAHFREEDIATFRPRKMMAEVLLLYVGKENRVFRCPSDRIIHTDDKYPPPAGKTTYFEWQGSSYDPMVGLSVNASNTTGTWEVSREDRFLDKLRLELGLPDVGDLVKVAIVYDYESFHGSENQPNSRQALFADFHVGDYGRGSK